MPYAMGRPSGVWELLNEIECIVNEGEGDQTPIRLVADVARQMGIPPEDAENTRTGPPGRGGDEYDSSIATPVGSSDSSMHGAGELRWPPSTQLGVIEEPENGSAVDESNGPVGGDNAGNTLTPPSRSTASGGNRLVAHVSELESSRENQPPIFPEFVGDASVPTSRSPSAEFSDFDVPVPAIGGMGDDTDTEANVADRLTDDQQLVAESGMSCSPNTVKGNIEACDEDTATAGEAVPGVDVITVVLRSEMTIEELKELHDDAPSTTTNKAVVTLAEATARMGHACVLCGSDVFVFGGMKRKTDLFAFNIVSRRCRRITLAPMSDNSNALQHADVSPAALIENRNRLPEVADPLSPPRIKNPSTEDATKFATTASNNDQTGDRDRVDPENSAQGTPTSGGDPQPDVDYIDVSRGANRPERRWGHSMVTFAHRLYVYGGRDRQGRLCGDLWVFNPMTQCWTAMVLPAYANEHPSVHRRANVDGEPIPDIVQPSSSRPAIAVYDGQTSQNAENSIAGRLPGGMPSAREGHSAIVWNGYMFVFGGISEENNAPSGEFWRLDLSTLTWRLLTDSQIGGCIKTTDMSSGSSGRGDSVRRRKAGGPSARFGHVAVAWGDAMYVFGGGAAARPSSSGSDADGLVATEWLNDLWVYDFVRQSWRVLDDRSGSVPSPRMGHAAAVVADRLLVHGGWGPPAGGEGAPQTLSDCFEFDFTRTIWRVVSALPDDTADTKNGQNSSPRNGRDIRYTRGAQPTFPALEKHSMVVVPIMDRRRGERVVEGTSPCNLSPRNEERQVTTACFEILFLGGSGNSDKRTAKVHALVVRMNWDVKGFKHANDVTARRALQGRGCLATFKHSRFPSALKQQGMPENGRAVEDGSPLQFVIRTASLGSSKGSLPEGKRPITSSAAKQSSTPPEIDTAFASDTLVDADGAVSMLEGLWWGATAGPRGLHHENNAAAVVSSLGDAQGVATHLGKAYGDLAEKYDELRQKSATFSAIARHPEIAGAFGDFCKALAAVVGEGREQLSCRICFEKPLECAFMPCGHVYCCEGCGRRVGKKMLKCPVCREDASRIMRIHIP